MVLSQPVITSFTPTSGPVGTSVTISGTGFSSTPVNNIVYFGATRAAVTTATATQLNVAVPIGATYQPITLLVNGLVGYSKFPFSTTYPGWGKVDATSFLPKVDVATGTFHTSLAIGDLDGDGKADLAVTTSINVVSIFRNTGTSGVISYAAQINFPTGLYPASVAIGDLDGDGKADLAVTNRGSNTISVFRNTGTPGAISYAAKIDFATGSSPRSIAFGDLDQDGRTDLAVTNYSHNTVSVFRNTGTPGTISYAAKIDFPTGLYPASVGIGDLDGDGKADLAVASSGSNRISVLRNTGTSGTISYAAKIDFATNFYAHRVAIGDLDGDGKADLAVANSGSSTISVLRNTGTPGTISYAAKIDFAADSDPNSLAIGDLDGDGKADLAVTNGGSSTVSVFRNTGTPGTISYAAKIDFATGLGPVSLAIGDLDGDGKADLAVMNGNTLSFLWHEPRPSQTITFNPLPNRALGDSPFTLTASSSSGLPISYMSSNTTVATITGNTVTIVGRGYTLITAFQGGNSTFLPASAVQQLLFVGPLPQITGFTPTSGPVGTAVTITGTGFNSTPANNIVYFGAMRATVTAATATQLTVTVPTGATYQPITVLVSGLVGYSKFPFSTTYPGWGKVDVTSFLPKVDFATGASPGSIAIGDLDGDGKADLAMTNFSSNTLSVFRNTGTTSTISYAAKIDFATGAGPKSVTIGDLDGDGKADLAVTNYNSYTLSVFRNTGTPGAISYAAKIDFAISAFPSSVAIGDLDGDGRADLAVANGGNGTLSIFRNTGMPGTISYAAKIDFATGLGPVSLAIGDLDGDSKADLAVANFDGNTISVLRNTGTPGTISYAAKIDFATGSGPKSLAIGDLDGDGKADLAVANGGISTVSVFRNTGMPGTISYAAKRDFETGLAPGSVAIGDLDGDGKADLAVANINSNTVSVFRNTGTPGTVSYEAKTDFATGSGPYSLAIGDLDGDGKADLAVTNYGSNTLSVLRHEPRASQTVTFNPLPSACINATVNLTATASSGLAISYTSSNPTIASVAGNVVTTLAAGTVTITASQAGNGTYSPATATQSLIVNPFPTATISASGATTFCQGGSVTLTASTGSSYLWSTGATTQSITVGTAGNYTVRVTNVNGCSATSAATTVIVNPLPTATITASGATSFCPGGSVILTASAGASYLWSTGATTQSITVGTAGNYTVRVTNVNGCSATSAATTVTIFPSPTATITASGAITFCQGGSVTLTTNSGSSYLWSTGATTQSITVSSGGNYTVRVTNANGCMSAASAPTTVTVNPPPVASLTAAASNIYGPVTLCSGSSVSLSTPFNPNYSYRWRNYQTYISGATSSSYTTSYGGFYVVEVTDNITLCSSQSNTLTVNINQKPSVYIVGDGATFCSGSSTSLTAVSSAPYFSWSTGEGGTQSINVYSGGTYYVTAYLNGCQSTAQATVYEQYCDPNPDPCAMYGICPCFDQFCPRKETPAGSEPSDDPNVSELSVFPNPAMAQVTVALPARVEVDTPVRFFDLLGRQQGNVNIPKGQWKVSVSLDQAAEGTYIIKVGQSGKSTKLIVKR
ncbi:MAG: FG-GAP-like repeat-containing protein [Cyclobacteriaceae bacterium]